MLAVPGREGQPVVPGSAVGTSIGVFTSGGDSQGMKITDRNIIFFVHLYYIIYDDYQQSMHFECILNLIKFKKE